MGERYGAAQRIRPGRDEVQILLFHGPMRHAPGRFTLLVLLLVLVAGCATDAPATTEVQATGFLRGQVLDAYTEMPVAGATVGLREGAARTITDDGGFFDLGAVSTGRRRIVLSAVGFLPGARANVVVEADAETVVTAHLFQDDPELALQERWLARPSRAEIPDTPPQTSRRADTTSGDLGATHAALEALPETIRVWRSQGTPLAPSSANGWADQSCIGDVEVLGFEEYVKGVIPHEWIPSWHPEALRAGAIAARSYAASHALGGGRWECADVDDGTVTQVYRDDRAGATDMAVDATAGVVVVRDDTVVRTEYSAENGHPTAGHDIDDPVCAGSTLFGHGRGACQWGTQRWATSTCFSEPCSFGSHGAAPKDHAWMMEHYFPGTTLSTGEPAAPCAVLGPDGGILDDAGPCFAAYGPAEYWRTESVGHDGGLHWTNAFESGAPGNWAAWSVHLEEAGEYRVEVYMVDAHAEWARVRYGVRHDGADDEVIFDQGAAGDGWHEIGVFAFAAGGDQRVAVFDNYSGAVPADQHIVADAIRITPRDTPGVDSGMPPVGTDSGVGDDAGADGGSPPITRPPGEVDSGCGCSSHGGGSPASVAWLAVVVVALLRRRRTG